jgi:hypothetical protein
MMLEEDVYAEGCGYRGKNQQIPHLKVTPGE